MFCINCGAELINGAKFCAKCGTEIIYEEKVQEQSQVTQDEPVADPVFTVEEKPQKSKHFQITVSKKLLIGIATAIIAIIAIILFAVSTNRPIDPDVIEGVEERAISECYETQLSDIEELLDEYYPDLTWKVGKPNGSSELKSHQGLGLTSSDGLYRVFVYVDIYLYRGGDEVGVTSAKLTGDIMLTDRNGGYKFTMMSREVGSDPYMYEGGYGTYTPYSGSSYNYSSNSISSGDGGLWGSEETDGTYNPSSVGDDLDLLEGWWMDEYESSVIYIYREGSTIYATQYDISGEITDEYISNGQQYQDSTCLQVGITSTMYPSPGITTQISYDYSDNGQLLYFDYLSEGSKISDVFYYLENGWYV